MIVLGLTGSIGMGKTTIAGMMQNLGIPVHDSDREVHRFLAPGHPASFAVAAAFPYYEHPEIYDKKTKGLNRSALGALVFSDDEKRITLENILHPLVRIVQQNFIRTASLKGFKTVCLDIPLLFETGAEKRVDFTIVASAPPFLQRQRVLARPNMTEEKFNVILARQMPDALKCAKADYTIKTGLGRAHALKTLKEILADITKKTNPPVKEKDKNGARNRS